MCGSASRMSLAHQRFRASKMVYSASHAVTGLGVPACRSTTRPQRGPEPNETQEADLRRFTYFYVICGLQLIMGVGYPKLG